MGNANRIGNGLDGEGERVGFRLSDSNWIVSNQATLGKERERGKSGTSGEESERDSLVMRASLALYSKPLKASSGTFSRITYASHLGLGLRDRFGSMDSMLRLRRGLGSDLEV